MINKTKNFIKVKICNKKGMSTIEVIFLVAVLMGLAILFGSKIKSFASKTMDELTDDKLFDKVDPGSVSTLETIPSNYIEIKECNNGEYIIEINGEKDEFGC